MASRRSRLKAVANLPIRRKPLSVQQEVETSKLQDENSLDLAFEAGEKEQENVGWEEASMAEKEEGTESVENVASSICESAVTEKLVPPEKAVQEGVDKDSNAEVPSSENICKTSAVNKTLPNPAPRFGRRVKPSVSLAVLKDRTPRVETETEASSKDGESPSVWENQLNSQNISNSTVLENELSKIVTTQEVGEEMTMGKFETTQNDDTGNLCGKLETVPTGHIIPEKSEGEMCHMPNLCDSPQKAPDRTLELSLKSPVISVNQSVSVSGLNSSGNTTPDLTSKQRNEVLSQTNQTLSEHSPNHTTSHNTFQLQISSMGVRRSASYMKQKKPKFNDFARKVADARREFQRKYEKIPPDRSSLRMIDLIFYNPSTNPMESKSKCEKKELTLSDQDLMNENKVDDPDPVDKSSDLCPDDERKADDFSKMPVPQVKIGSNGEIILDEKSLVIETTDAKKGREDLQNSVPIFEDRGSKTCYYKRKTQKSRDWSDLETKRFYKALNTIGTDFSLMQKYFPVRTRLELKNKFKREEKLNRNLVDKALNNPSEFDITQFEKYLAMEKQLQEEETERRLQRKIRVKRPDNRVRTKSSMLAKEITESDEEVSELHSPSQADQARMKLIDRAKKANDIDLLCERYSLKESDAKHDGNNQQFAQSVALDVVDQDKNFTLTSKVFANPSIMEASNAYKIRDAFEEIQNIKRTGIKRTGRGNRGGKKAGCGDSGDAVAVIDEFYKAVVSLSASLKSQAKKAKALDVISRKVKPSTKGEKRKAPVEAGRRQYAKKQKERPYTSTLDIETYDSKCDSNSSSNESNDNSLTSTKTITDQDFIKLLAANAQNMQESKIQFQITESCSLEKNVEIILDNVPSLSLTEI